MSFDVFVKDDVLAVVYHDYIIKYKKVGQKIKEPNILKETKDMIINGWFKVKIK